MKKIIISILATLCLAGTVHAQQLFRSTYFLEGYNMRHQFNPAFAPNTSYFAISGLSSLGIETQSNLGVSTFIYPKDGGLTTFMNSAVSADEVLNKLRNNNQINIDNNISLLSIGIKKPKSFYSFDLNVRTQAAFNLPYSLFDFMKNAGISQHYDISGLSANCDSRVEFAFGYGRNINDRIRVGGRLKFLVGIANINADIDEMKIQMTEDKWTIKSNGRLESASPLYFKTKGETGAKIKDPSDEDLIDFKNIGFFTEVPVNGYGAAIDLGAEMEVVEGLKISLAVNDLGYMCWTDATIAKTSGEDWSFDGFDDISLDGGKDNSISKQFKALRKDIAAMYDFRRTDIDAKYGKMLAATINAGAEYTMPFYEGMSVGLLGTSYINGNYSWTEGRLFLNLKPAKWFSAGVNGAISKFGPTLGAVIGIHVSGFNLFLGTDHLPFNYAKAYKSILYPYGKANTSVNFGLSFNLGKNK